MFKRYYFFFHYCLLFCRYVMLQKRILSKPKWGAQAVVRGATALPSDGTTPRAAPTAKTPVVYGHQFELRSATYSMPSN